MTLTTQFLYYFYLYIVIYATLGEATDLIAKEIRLLDQIDNSQVVEGLIMNVDQVLNDYIRDQISVECQLFQVISFQTFMLIMG